MPAPAVVPTGQRRREASFDTSQFIDGTAQLADHQVRIAQQTCAMRGRRHATRRAIEQRHADTALDLGQRLGDGRLRNIQRRRHASDLAEVFQRDQQPEVAQGQRTLQESTRDVRHDELQPALT